MFMPTVLAKSFEIKVSLSDGRKETIFVEKENKKRSVIIGYSNENKNISLTVFENWGKTKDTHIFTFELF